MPTKSKAPMSPDVLTRALDYAKIVVSDRAGAELDKEGLSDFKRTVREVEQDRKNAVSITLAVLHDRPCPISIFRPWISYDVLYRMERAGKIKLERKNAKILMRPSAFFALFESLPADVPLAEKRRRSA